jgi:FkbM family methyltransferase
MFSNIARIILPSSIKDVLQVYRPLSLGPQIKDLGILETGIGAGDLPYIKLRSGKIFHGTRPTGLEKFIYKVIPSYAKKNLPEYAFRIALDIIFRYRGSKDSPLKSGKFYGFGPGETVVECGAYLGYYSMKASEIVGETGRVIAIEPIEENLKIFRENVKANALSNVTIIPKGIWNGPRQMAIFREQRQRASLIENVVEGKERHTISCDSIDNILQGFNLDTIGFIRIQVNGAELEALEGMRHSLPKTKRILVSALYKRNGKYAYSTVERILTTNGFQTTVANGNVLGLRD